MRILTKSLLLLVLTVSFSTHVEAQKGKKVKVSQDAFVQGGDKADEPLGATIANRLRIMKSTGDDKYSRTSFLQFNLKKVKDFETAELFLCVKVYESKDDASAKFQMQVYTCEDNSWKETSITFNNQPDKGELLAAAEIEVTEKNEWVKISLPVEKLKELIKKDAKRKVSFVLFNEDFNRTSAEVISKERTWTNGTPANREAYILFK